MTVAEKAEVDGLELPTRFGQVPGAIPGVDPEALAAMPPGSAARVTCIDYGPALHECRAIEDVEDFLVRHRPEGTTVRWINVDGIGDPSVIRALAVKYNLHPLAVEDLLDPNQRPKIDVFGEEEGMQPRIFLIVRMIQLLGETLSSEQISIFLGHSTVLTFQQTPGDVWDPIRRRIAKEGSRIRGLDASYLLYALLDAIVDYCFPVLEHYGDRLEELEDLVLDRPDRRTIGEIHELKRELLLLRRAVWPMREVVNGVQREPHECVSENSRIYLRDVYDHAIQIMDIIETYREVASSLTETYMTSMSNRLSEVMKVLTIIGTIFIPLTFLVGVYGMNFEHMPELKMRYGYPTFWILSLLIAGGMIAWFRRRGWIGSR